jgi:hypothetical protein
LNHSGFIIYAANRSLREWNGVRVGFAIVRRKNRGVDLGGRMLADGHADALEIEVIGTTGMQVGTDAIKITP